MANTAPSAVGGRQLTIVRELGARRVPTQAAHWGSGASSELVVVQKWRTDEDEAAALHALDAAQAMCRLRNANVARAREAVRREGKILLVSDWIDGVTYADLFAAAKEKNEIVPLAVTLRVLLDALAGLVAIHALRDKTGKSLAVYHGALSPDQLIVGTDGVTRVLTPCPGAPTLDTGGAHTVRFAAPELLLGDETADARVDVYALGVMLWEALAEKKLFEESTAGAILTRHLAGKVDPAPARKDPSWAEPLGPIAQHAIATDPGSRFASATELATEVKKLAATHAAKGIDVAGWVEKLAGVAIAARREKLQPAGAKPKESKDAPKGGLPYARKPLGASSTVSAATPPIAPPPAKIEPAKIESAKIEPTKTETKSETAIEAKEAPAKIDAKVEPAKAPPVRATAMRIAAPAPLPVAAASSSREGEPPIETTRATTPVVAPIAAPIAAPADPPPPPSFQEVSDDEVEIAPPSAPPPEKMAMPPLPKIPPLTAPPSVAEIVDRAAATTPSTLPLPDVDGDARRRRRRAIVLVPIALCLLLLLFVGLRSAFHGEEHKTEEPIAATTHATTTGATNAATKETSTVATATAPTPTATPTGTNATSTTSEPQPTAAVVAAPIATETPPKPAPTTASPTTPTATKSPPRTKPTYDPLGI